MVETAKVMKRTDNIVKRASKRPKSNWEYVLTAGSFAGVYASRSNVYS